MPKSASPRAPRNSKKTTAKTAAPVQNKPVAEKRTAQNTVAQPEAVPVPTISTPRERATVLVTQGIALLGRNKAEDAIKLFDDAIRIDPEHPDAWGNRGVALRRLKQFEQALASYMRGLEFAEEKAVQWANIANCQVDLGRREEAQAALLNAMRLKPNQPEHWRLLSSLIMQKGHSETAEAMLRRAIALAPDDAPTLVRLGGMMNQLGDHDLAVEILSRAIFLSPLLADAHSSLGQTLISMGRLAEGETSLRRALELDTEHLDARLGLARKLLLEGALETGWVEYEWRRRKPESKISKLPGIEWNGEPLQGKTLLIHAEQGFGDLIQFVRYVPQLAVRGAKVVLALPQVLRDILGTVEGVVKTVSNIRDVGHYDFHIPLLSIPRLLGIAPDKIPNKVPYLHPPAGPTLPTPAGTRLKVGIVWAGSPKHANDRNRSLTLETLLPLAGIHGVSLFSLQTGPHSGDISKEAHGLLVRDLSGQLRTFSDTANIIRQLDLVICVDTSVAHLAGALGKPVWVLTPFAPDWRWILGRDDNPWYPTMRLLRQNSPKRWDDVIDRAVAMLSDWANRMPDPAEQGDTVVHSVFPGPGGRPRFRMWIPRPYLKDVGLRFLARTERWDGGYEYSTRSLIDTHLLPGDLFIDVGAHWGVMSLQAASRWPEQVRVIACEPDPKNVENLRRNIDGNGLGRQIEIVPGAIADRPGRGELRPESTMGYKLIHKEDGSIPVRSVDSILADRPDLQNRRVIVKIDVEGSEIEVIEGMRHLLDSGRVALIIWEKGHDYATPQAIENLKAIRARMSSLGFSAWRFGREEDAGALRPFAIDEWTGNVFEFSPQVQRQATYGLPRPAPVPQAPEPFLEAYQKAGDLIRVATEHQARNQIPAALASYDQAALHDLRHPDMYNNVGVALRGMGRLVAAAVCYRRAIALNPRNVGSISNLANVLRELGRHAEAAELHNRAIKMQPANPRTYYNAGLVARDAGLPAQSRRFFEKVLELDPANDECRWDWALSLLQEGDYRRGLPAYESRWGLTRSQDKMTSLPEWKGEPLNGKTLFLHDEQGFGDVLMFARFIPEAKRRGAGKIILQCQPELMRLMAGTPHVDMVIRRGQEPPADCDVFAPLLSLGGLFGYDLPSLPHDVPYLTAPIAQMTLPETGRQGGDLKMGLVWAGKPTPRDRSYPLRKMLPALGDPRWSVYSMQLGPRVKDLYDLGAQTFITDLSSNLLDFAESGAILKQLDVLVTCDTSIAHLAGALGIPTFVLLLYTSDWRWFDKGSTSPWYPTMRIFRQPAPGDWDTPIRQVAEALQALAQEKSLIQANPVRLP